MMIRKEYTVGECPKVCTRLKETWFWFRVAALVGLNLRRKVQGVKGGGQLTVKADDFMSFRRLAMVQEAL
jgi:hypothetical protein